MFKRITTIIALIVITFAISGSVAQAATPTPPPPPPGGDVKYAPNGRIDNPDRRTPGGVARTQLSGGSSSGGDVTTQQIAPNPYGCYGQTDYPHKSNGDASTHSRTRCNVQLPRVSVWNSMYRGRWYGAEYLASGSSSRNFSTTSYDAVARWWCYGVGTYTYETNGYHEAWDGGTTYTGDTRQSNRFYC